MPSYPQYRSTGFEDERRRPYGGVDSYKRSESRKIPRDHSRGGKEPERDWDRDRGRSMASGSRDSTDARSPYGKRRETEVSKDLHLDTTKIPTGPRRAVSDAYSPASAVNSIPTSGTRHTPIEPGANSITKTSRISSPSPISPPIIPKTKDPGHQEYFDALFKGCEILQERVLLKLRKDKNLREDHQRRNELCKIASKVNDYAPYSEIKRRFDEKEKLERDEISTSSSRIDQQYAEFLEGFVSIIASPKSQAVDNTSLQALEAKLEAKFAELQKQNSEQQKQILDAQTQIRTLHNEQKQSAQAFNDLDKGFKALKSDHDTLQSENSQLKRQIAGLDHLNKTQDDLNELAKNFRSLTNRVDDIEGNVTVCVDKFKSFDMDTYSDVFKGCIDDDFKSKVFSNEKVTETLRQDLSSLQELALSRFDKADFRIQETRKLLEDLQNSQPAISQPARGSSVDQIALEALIEKKMDTLRAALESIAADTSNTCAEMVDELVVRVETIESAIKDLENLPTEICALKQAGDEQHNVLHDLQESLHSLEVHGVVPKLDKVIIKLTDVESRINKLQRFHAAGGMIGPNTLMGAIKSDMDDAKKRFDALELAVRTLDSQWANVNSKQMAIQIIQHLDSSRHTVNDRIVNAEAGVSELKGKLTLLEHNLALLRDPKYLATILKASPPLGKRPASPGSSAGGPIKKRKPDTKGQQQQSDKT
ncbi:hypothetical protein F5Y11DRAFT_152246 [Daldinia sp. FL1419]|nr:hypothetical protein F5Y11DRAFT_152246 [Daldinia sp. FL1419]